MTAVGGTSVSLDASGNRLSPDVTWNDSFGSSGGGMSALFARPAYQDGVAGIVGTKRGVPDVSMMANGRSAGAAMYKSFDGKPAFLAARGTSLAAPMFAGVVAMADQLAGQSLGSINPALYKLGTSANPALYGIIDVTSGNNTFNGVTGYSAGTGYDLVTGLGTIDAARFVPALAAAAGLTPSAATVILKPDAVPGTTDVSVTVSSAIPGWTPAVPSGTVTLGTTTRSLPQTLVAGVANYRVPTTELQYYAAKYSGDVAYQPTLSTPAVIARPDGVSVQPLAGQTTTIDALSNDSSQHDPDSEEGRPFVIAGVTQPPGAPGVVTTDGASISYTTRSSAYRGPVTFSYTITDGIHAATSTVTVNTYIPNPFGHVKAASAYEPTLSAGPVSVLGSGPGLLRLGDKASAEFGWFDFGSGIQDVTIHYSTTTTATQGALSLRLNSPTNPVVATIPIDGKKTDVTAKLSGSSPIGMEHVYLTYAASASNTGALLLDWFSTNQPPMTAGGDSVLTRYAADPPCYVEIGGQIGAGCLVSSWQLDLGQVDFGVNRGSAWAPQLNYSSWPGGSALLVLDKPDNPPVATFTLNDTGVGPEQSAAGHWFEATGVHRVYLIPEFGATTGVLETTALSFTSHRVEL